MKFHGQVSSIVYEFFVGGGKEQQNNWQFLLFRLLATPEFSKSQLLKTPQTLISRYINVRLS